LTYQYRIVLTLNREEQTLTLLAIGSHDEVYGSSD
jgi:mRNA-degrading endonuclease RelE of RelBE toxin-antitoxin system